MFRPAPCSPLSPRPPPHPHNRISLAALLAVLEASSPPLVHARLVATLDEVQATDLVLYSS